MKQIQKITSSNKPEHQITKKHTHKNKQTEKNTNKRICRTKKKKIHHQHITSTGSVDLES
jgi:hypothetical protein